jgi:hypothetical protein
MVIIAKIQSISVIPNPLEGVLRIRKIKFDINIGFQDCFLDFIG